MTVLYEDNHIIAVNKTCSEIVQGDKTGDEPLSETIKKYLKDLSPELVDKKYNDFQTYFGNPEIQENIRNLKEEEFQEGFIVSNLIINCFMLPSYNYTFHITH